MSLLEKTPAASEMKGSINPLFDEDPVNDYEEEVVLTTYMTNTLEEHFVKKQMCVAEEELLQSFGSEEKVEESENFMESWKNRTGRYTQYIRSKRTLSLGLTS